MIKIGPNWPKIARNGPKYLKMVQNGPTRHPYCPKLPKIIHPDPNVDIVGQYGPFGTLSDNFGPFGEIEDNCWAKQNYQMAKKC